MGIVVNWAFEAAAASLLAYPVIWLLLRSPGTKAANWLHVLGLLATMFGSALIRYAAVFVVGGASMVHPEDEMGLLVYLGFPIVAAVGAVLAVTRAASGRPAG